MTAKKYTSKIEFDDETNSLKVDIKYERVYTEREEEQAKYYFRWKFSKKEGREIPIEKIEVEPRAGDIIEERTVFGVLPDRELYADLERVNRIAPYVIPLLIADLKRYGKKNKDKKKLVEHAIKDLEKIVNQL